MRHLIPLSLLLLAGAAAAQQGAPVPQMRMVPVVRMRAQAPPPAFTGEGGTVPMHLSGVMAVVEVKIGGKSFRFAVDTGAGGHGRIRPEVAEALGLQAAGEAIAGDTSGRQQTRRIFAAPALEVAGTTFRDLRLTEMPNLAPLAGIDGILGLGLFQSHTLTLDYARGKMTLSRKPLPESAVSYPAGPGAVTVPLRIGTIDVPAQLDTGNSIAPFVVPEALAKQLPLRGEPRVAGSAMNAFGRMEIKQADLAAPVTLNGVALPVTTVTWPSLGPFANLGAKALGTSVVTIDQPNHRVRILVSPKP